MRLIMNGGMNGNAAESAERRYGRVFDELAGEYDRRPPAYPDELIDQACRSRGSGAVILCWRSDAEAASNGSWRAQRRQIVSVYHDALGPHEPAV